MFNLKGRTGIVTGASSGIGYAVANALAQAGAKVYVFSRTGAPKNGEDSIHSGIQHLKVDITNYPKVKQLVDEISAGGLDFLVNNAGITIKKRAEELTPEEFEQIHKVNVFAVFQLSAYAYPYLKQSIHVGRIVNISSMAAYLGFSQVVPYCSSKGAVLGLTRGLAVEWAQDNITVNSIAPGWFPSEMSRQVMDDDRKAKILARMPLHRFGDAEDLGAMTLFLLSDSAKYITGQDYAVDGGALAFGF